MKNIQLVSGRNKTIKLISIPAMRTRITALPAEILNTEVDSNYEKKKSSTSETLIIILASTIGKIFLIPP